MRNETEENPVSLHTGRNIFIGLLLITVVGGGFFLFFNKGLYILPGKVCDSSVDRGVAIRTLPLTRAADHRTNRDGEGADFKYFCVVSTSRGPRMEGNVSIQDASPSVWADYAPDPQYQLVTKTSQDGIEALARTGIDDSDDGFASVYVPCTPPLDPYGLDGKSDTKPHTYALVTDVDVNGETRATGAELRQNLTDFAYQITRHAYKLAKCEESRDFPEQLPRYKAKSD